MNFKRFCCLCLVLVIFPATAFSQADPAFLSALKPTVVNLKVSNDKYFGVASQAGKINGTGFVVDRTRGLIVTNRHVAREFPSHIEVYFFDGSSTTAKLIYGDAFHDFSILAFDPKTVSFDLKEVVLGDFFSAKEGDPVWLIGNNEVEEYSVKSGHIIALAKNKGDMHSLAFQTSFDRTGGSSGSPVWNQKGEVIGLHFKGTDTSSFELAINYVKDKLAELTSGKEIKRGSTGIVLQLAKIEDAVKYLKLSESMGKTIKEANVVGKEVLYVNQLIPGFVLNNEVIPGDIVFKLNGQIMTNNLYLFDRLVDQQTGHAVTLTVVRGGNAFDVSLPVKDVESQKIKQFVLFAGATIHPLTNEVRFYHDITEKGLFIPQVAVGSSFHSVGTFSSRVPDRKAVLITAINGTPVETLEALKSVVSQFTGNENIAVTFKDFLFSNPLQVKMVTLDLKTTPTTFFEYDDKTHEWVEK